MSADTPLHKTWTVVWALLITALVCVRDLTRRAFPPREHTTYDTYQPDPMEW